ncbi:hypothetical protein [Streptomyces sp. TRM64462]|uniref:hypothetical protein n=1 Tax=Streptomyces sp. TRM64462 TaxID=2741726 RepID=UPI001585EE09|nr:hypothetical protein [Streptomyces sp. TRM64462]
MISEPELVGGPEDGAGDGHGDVLDSTRVRDSRPRPYRRWLWALGGALTASALWAAGLVAYQGRGPDLGGYRASDDLCAEAELPALVTALGERGTGGGLDEEARHEALDESRCSMTLGPPRAQYDVGLSYELHKKTDPGPEFSAREGSVPGYRPPTVRVPGLGDEAFFTDADTGYAVLSVVDGQAVLALTVSAAYTGDPEDPDQPQEPGQEVVAALSGVKEFMVEDMKALMARLKSPAPPPSPSASGRG